MEAIINAVCYGDYLTLCCYFDNHQKGDHQRSFSQDGEKKFQGM